MEDKEKVRSILAKLNRGLKDKPWVAVNGNNMMPFSYNDSRGSLKYDMSRGYTVKLFVNASTGEIKFYASALLEA